MEKKSKKKKEYGFTLIELLITIGILAIIVSIAFVLYRNYSDSIKDKVTELEKKELIDSASMYYAEFGQSPDYLSYETEEEIDGVKKNVTYSCISVLNLVDKGYYKKKVAADKFNEKEVVEVKEIEGVATYKFLDLNTLSDSGDSHCTYWVEGEDVTDIDVDISYENDSESSVKLYPRVVKNEDKTFDLYLKLVADTVEIKEESSVPVYVSVVLDSSGSMSGTKHTQALASSKTLSEEIVKIDDSYVSLINFDYTAYLRRDFKHNSLIDSDFKSPKGLTNIPSALLMAYRKNKGFDSKAIKYVIFLTDGRPESPTSYNEEYFESKEQFEKFLVCKNAGTIPSGCKSLISGYANDIKGIDNMTLVVIGYSISDSFYSTLPTLDNTGTRCPNSDNGKYCYYKSDSSSINDLFKLLSNTITEVVKAQTVSNAQIKALFDSYLIIKDKNGNDVTNDFNVSFNIKDSESGSQIYEKEYVYNIKVKDIAANEYTMNEDNTVGTYTLNMFENFDVYLYDYDNNVIKKIEMNENNIPVITVTRTLKSYLN